MLLNLGYDNFVPLSQVDAIISKSSQTVDIYYRNLPPDKQLTACNGKRTQSYVFLVSGKVVKSAVQSDTLRKRWEARYEVHGARQGSTGVQAGEGPAEICNDEAESDQGTKEL